jgi:hypothetical protein
MKRLTSTMAPCWSVTRTDIGIDLHDTTRVMRLV